jgi:hypothetical protein
MKKIFFIVLSIGLTYNALAQQWLNAGAASSGNQNMNIWRNGRVAIGRTFSGPSTATPGALTVQPNAFLHVQSSNNAADLAIPTFSMEKVDLNFANNGTKYGTMDFWFTNNPASGINIANESFVMKSELGNADMLFMPNNTKPGLMIKNNGKVGIGIGNPLASLDILESNPNSEANIYVRTQTANVAAKLFLINGTFSNGIMTHSTGTGHIMTNVNSPNQADAVISWNGTGSVLIGDQNLNAAIPNNKVTISTTQNTTKALSIQNNGSEMFKIFGNGTAVFSSYSTNGNDDVILVEDALTLNKPNFKVKKNGFVYAREVTVTLNAFPDYVFESNYKLPSLSEVRSHIKSNHRLINMPSASEVERNGANIGEIQKVTVEKLEEAYLYILQLEDKIEALSKKIENIEKK